MRHFPRGRPIPASSIDAARDLVCVMFPRGRPIPASSFDAAKDLVCAMFPRGRRLVAPNIFNLQYNGVVIALLRMAYVLNAVFFVRYFEKSISKY